MCPNNSPPDLWPENEDAMDLWRAVRTQWRASAFGLIGLDYGALDRAAERMGIELSVCTMKKIQAMESWYLDETRKDSK